MVLVTPLRRLIHGLGGTISASFGLVTTFSQDLEDCDPYLEWVDLVGGRRNGTVAGIDD